MQHNILMERYRDEIESTGRRYHALILQECDRLLVNPVDVPHLETDLNNVYQTYAWLFRATCQVMPRDVFESVALVGRYYLTEAMLLDWLCDGQAHWPDAYSLLPSVVQDAARDILSQLFEPQAEFWRVYADRQHRYRLSIALERQHQRKLQSYTEEEFEAIATGVMAKAQIVTSALFYRLGEPELIPAATRSQNGIAIADRIMDDLTDWRSDLEAGNFTRLLTEIAAGLGVTDVQELDAETVGRSLYLDGHLERHLQMALDALTRTIDDATILRSSAWVAFVLRTHEELRTRQAAVHRTLQRIREGLVGRV